MRGSTTVSSRQYLRIASSPPKRAPMPDSFQPPIGAVVHIRFATTSLMFTAPQSSNSAMSLARLTSREKTDADSP